MCLVPGVTDAFYARLAERAGFAAVFVTGGGAANTLLGVPDLGLTTLAETVDLTERVAAAVNVPVIVDADTGYGNHLNVIRTVSELERAGVAALTLEDQVTPKRCGHFEGKRVVPTGEMIEKLVAATIARRDPNLAIIARTDAIAVEGLAGALRRARSYVAAGADAVFVEAPRSVEELAAIPAEIPAPCVVNVVEGGLTPLLSAHELEHMGYRVAIYANLALRVAARSVERALRVLREEGDSRRLLDRMLTWEERQEAAGLPEWQRLEETIVAAAREIEERAGDSGVGPKSA